MDRIKAINRSIGVYVDTKHLQVERNKQSVELIPTIRVYCVGCLVIRINFLNWSFILDII